MILGRAPAVLAAPMALRGAALIAALSVTSAAGWARGAAVEKTAPFHAELETHPHRILARVPAELSFTVKDSRGASIRFLQFVHERPLHLIVVSADLSSFD